jgi:hypothetical protein
LGAGIAINSGRQAAEPVAGDLGTIEGDKRAAENAVPL